jgi:hypothetical protein
MRDKFPEGDHGGNYRSPTPTQDSGSRAARYINKNGNANKSPPNAEKIKLQIVKLILWPSGSFKQIHTRYNSKDYSWNYNWFYWQCNRPFSNIHYAIEKKNPSAFSKY